MKQYLGTKLLFAVAMTRQAFCDYIDREIDPNTSGDEPGYLVEYTDGGKANHPSHEGYISWSPADVFERSYRPVDGLSFSLALEALKQGKQVRRHGWNGKDQFVYMVPADKVQSSIGYGFGEYIGEPTFASTLVLRNAQNMLVLGWVPSSGDLFADDWGIVQ